MNVLLFEEGELDARFEERCFVVKGERASHLINRLKVQPGTKLRIGQIDGLLGWGRVESLSNKDVIIQVLELNEPISQLPIDLLIAMPRPQILKKVLESSASMGIRRILITASERVEKSYFSSKILRTEEIKKYLQLGLEQGVDTVFPEVEICQNLSKSIKKLEEVKIKIIAHPLGLKSFGELSNSKDLNSNSIVFAIGPERGWSESEVAKFVADGYIPVSMGSRQLRVDTAVVAVMSQIILLREVVSLGRM